MSNGNNLVEMDSEKLGGTPIFYGTRVPIQNLFAVWRRVNLLTNFSNNFRAARANMLWLSQKNRKRDCLSAMKVLLDKCVTRYLKPEFIRHEILTVATMKRIF